jgi:hypothetical protein
MKATWKLAYVALTTAVVVPVALAASAQLSNDQQSCIDGYNNQTRKVSQQAGMSARNCIKNAGKGKETDPENCIVNNTDGKIALKEAKVTLLYTVVKCLGTEPIQQGAVTGNAAHRGALTDLAHDVFGNPVSGVVSPGKNEAKCQDHATLRAVQLFTEEVKALRGCKKTAMKAGTVTNSTTLEAQCMTPWILDPKEKIDKKKQKLLAEVNKDCMGLTLSLLFPGRCATEPTTTDVADCIEERTECRVCLALNAADGTSVNCDLIDNGVADGSC